MCPLRAGISFDACWHTTSRRHKARWLTPSSTSTLALDSRGAESVPHRQFGVPNPPLTYVVGATTATSGLVNGDVLTGALTTSATQTSPSGDYLILQGTLAASSNYTFTYTGAVLKIALPPLQSLSSFVARPSDLNVTFATEQAQGCTDSEVSEKMRETGSVKLGDGSGSTSCK